MIHRLFSRRLAVAILIVLSACTSARHASAQGVVVYYDDVERGRGILFAGMVYNLVGHFRDDIVMRSVLDYQAGDLDHYDHALYLGYRDTVLPDAFLADVLAGGTKVMWISGNIPQLINFAGEDALGFGGGDFAAPTAHDRIKYNDRTLRRAGDLAHFVIDPGPNAQVVVEMFSSAVPSDRSPYYVRVGALDYIADNPFPDETIDNRSLVFADYLHEFFGTDTGHRLRALVRFEDLAPGVSDEGRLDFFSKKFQKEGIPFGVGVIPVFYDPSGELFSPGTRFDLPGDAEFRDAIDRMLERGGTLVDHGYTHQHDGGISRVDWEFTQGADNAPLPVDSADWVRTRMENALALFADSGWKPLIWETPHYSASHGDYSVFAEYYQFFYERPLVFPIPVGDPPVFAEPLSPVTQIVPYELQTSTLGRPIIPENLGYIDPGDPYADPQVLLNWASDLTVIRDAVASFYFHHDWVDPSDVDTVIDGLRDLGYEFVGVDDIISYPDDGNDGSGSGGDDDDDDEDSGACGC